MNLYNFLSFIQHSLINQAILLLYLVIALFIAAYNWLYLYHSLHVSSKHIGVAAPPHVRYIINLSIILAIIAALLSMFFFIIGFY